MKDQKNTRDTNGSDSEGRAFRVKHESASVIPKPPGPARRLAILLALIFATTVTLVLPSTGSASYVSVDETKWVSKGELSRIADSYAEAAHKARIAGGGCSKLGTLSAGAFASALLYYNKLRVTPFGVVTGVAAKLTNIAYGWFSGLDFCDIALKSASGASWATYHSRQGGAWTRFYVYHETRRLRPDVCHYYQAFASPGDYYYWRVNGLVAGCKGV